MRAIVIFMRFSQPGLVRQLPSSSPLLSPEEDELVLGTYPIRDPGAFFAGKHSVVVGHGSAKLSTRLLLGTEHNLTGLDSPPERERLQQESNLLIDLVRGKGVRLRIRSRIICGHIETTREARVLRSLLPRSAIRIQSYPMPIFRPKLHPKFLDVLGIPEQQTACIDHMMEHMVLIAVKVRIEPDGDLPGFMEWEPRRQFRTAPLGIIGGGTVEAFLVLVQAAVDLDDEGAAVEDLRRFLVDLPVDG